MSQNAKAVAKEVIETVRKGKKVNLQKIQQKHGYSKSSAKAMKAVRTKTYQDILGTYLSEDFLATKHKELFGAKQLAYFIFNRKMKDEDIVEHLKAAGLTTIVIRESDKGKMAFYSIDDSRAKRDALDLAYKVTGKYPKEGPKVAVQINTVDISDAQFKKVISYTSKRLGTRGV